MQQYQKNKDFFSFANGKVTCTLPNASNANQFSKAYNGVINREKENPEVAKWYSEFQLSSTADDIARPAIRVIAKTADGTKMESSHIFCMAIPCTSLGMNFLESAGSNVYYIGSNVTGWIYVLDLQKAPFGAVVVKSSTFNSTLAPCEFAVESSNPEVASGFVTFDNQIKYRPNKYRTETTTGLDMLQIYAHGKGDCTLTVKALDGTGKTAQIKIRVQ